MSKSTTKTPAPTTPNDEPENTNIDNMDALNGDIEGAGVVMKGLGVERCRAALAGMKAITNVLFQLDLNKDCTGGIQAKSMTTTGLIQALAVCTEFVRNHLDGGGMTSHTAQAVDFNTPAYADLKALHSRACTEGGSV